MKEQKNIERLFQEKFKDFEATPPQGSWDSIASRLNEKKKKRRVIPFWFQMSGVAASFVIIGTLIWNFQSTENKIQLNNSDETVVGVDNKTNDNENSITPFESDETLKSNESNQNTTLEKQEEKLGKSNTKFDSNLLNSNKSNTKVVSNENQNIRSKTKNNTINFPKNKKEINNQTNKKENRYNNNTYDKSNSVIVVNSKKNKTKRSKSANESLVQNNDFILSDNDNTSDKLVGTKNVKNKTNPNEKINVAKIEALFNANQNDTNYVNTNSDTEEKNGLDTTNVIVASSENVTNQDSTLVAEISPEINPLEELLKEKEAGKNEDEKEKEKRDRWAVSTNASPVYFNSLAEGSSLDQEFETNEKNYSTTISYGVAGTYQISDKISVRTGVNNILLSYNTNDVIYESTLSATTANNVENITRNDNGNAVNFYSKNSSQASLNGDVENFTQENIGSLKQDLSYIEVPLEISYKLLDKKFGIEVIGGMSTLFLNNNSVSLVTNGMEMNIGKANNLNNIHFSSNVGLGFKYSFWKNLNANFQPMFKYQINTFSENSGNFKPYFIGLYTGISFSF